MQRAQRADVSAPQAPADRRPSTATTRYAARVADARKFELDELVNRPGTYFNPQTEILVVVDDSPELDSEIFNMEEYEGADWVLVSDETPVDENRRDELLEGFQVRAQPAAAPEDEDEYSEEYEDEEEDVGRE